jgi:hypothetical protein
MHHLCCSALAHESPAVVQIGRLLLEKRDVVMTKDEVDLYERRSEPVWRSGFRLAVPCTLADGGDPLAPRSTGRAGAHARTGLLACGRGLGSSRQRVRGKATRCAQYPSRVKKSVAHASIWNGSFHGFGFTPRQFLRLLSEGARPVTPWHACACVCACV